MPASYPVSLATFLTYYDQPPDPVGKPGVKTAKASDGTLIDLTIDAALITRQIQQEIVAIEKTIGANPFRIPELRGTPPGPKNPPAVAMQGYLSHSIHWLLFNTAWGRADSNGVVPPTPPPSHNHTHGHMLSNGPTFDQHHRITSVPDDHPQYMRRDGSRAFTHPVAGRNATDAHHLVTLGQVQGLTAAQVNQTIQDELTENLVDPFFPGVALKPMTGPDSRRWRLTGGYFYGPTDVNGNIYIDFSRARFSGLASFSYMKHQFPGQSMLGWYNFQYMEDQLILLNLSAQGAWIQFLEDIVVDRQANVAMTWMALGI